MKEYLKPQVNVNVIVNKNNIASSGLEGWLNGGSAAYEGVAIVTYDFVTES